MSEKLINISELNRLLKLKRSSMRLNKVPAKHASIVNELIQLIKDWRVRNGL
jgi:hypothetical protein